MEEFNPYEALTQSREGSFSQESIDNAEELQNNLEKKQAERQQQVQNEEAKVATPESEETTTQEDPKNYLDEVKNTVETLQQGGETLQEFVYAAPAGTLDFTIDALNLTPLDIPKLPEFENDIAQAYRDISSFIIPAYVLARAAGGAGTAAHAKIGWAIGNDPLVKLFAGMGLNAGTGAFVDFTNANSLDGHNASGALRDALPELFWWIPEDIATLDSDSPEVKRDKSVKEGTALGIFTDLALGMATLARGIKGMRSSANKFIPENETAEAFWKNPAAAGDETKTALETPSLDVKTLSKAETGDEMLALLEGAAKTVDDSAARRADALDELGSYNSSKDASLDEPMLGVNNELFEATEMGIRSVDPEGIHGAAVDAARIQENIGTSYGRMGSIVTEPALKHGLEADSITKREFIEMLKKSLREGGKYSY